MSSNLPRQHTNKLKNRSRPIIDTENRSKRGTPTKTQGKPKQNKTNLTKHQQNRENPKHVSRPLFRQRVSRSWWCYLLVLFSRGFFCVVLVPLELLLVLFLFLKIIPVCGRSSATASLKARKKRALPGSPVLYSLDTTQQLTTLGAFFLVAHPKFPRSRLASLQSEPNIQNLPIFGKHRQDPARGVPRQVMNPPLNSGSP